MEVGTFSSPATSARFGPLTYLRLCKVVAQLPSIPGLGGAVNSWQPPRKKVPWTTIKGPLPLGAWPRALLSAEVGEEFGLSFGQSRLLEPFTGAGTQEANMEMAKLADRSKGI